MQLKNKRLKNILRSKHLAQLLLLMAFACTNIYGQDKPLKFSYLTVDDGLSHTDANDVKQDSLGFIWIATHFGLDRYDGYNIKKYYNSNTPKDNAFKNRIISIMPDEGGNLWLCTEGGIQLFNSRTETYTDFFLSNKADNVNAYTKLIKLNGNTLAALGDGIFSIFTIDSNKLIKQNIGLPKKIMFADMAVEKSGNLWLLTGQGIWIMDKLYHFKYLDLSPLKEKNFSQLYFDNRNNVLLWNEAKILLISKPFLDKEIISGQLVKQDAAIRQFLIPDGTYPNDIVQEKDGNYWVSTDAELLYLDSTLNKLQTITNKSFVNSINASGLNRLFIDKSECLWACTHGGGVNVCNLNSKLFYTIQRNPESNNTLSGNHIRSVLAEDGKKIWIGTDANGLNLYDIDKRQFTLFNTDTKIRLAGNEITSLALDNEQNLWVGSDNGIDVINRQRNQLLKLAGSEGFPKHVIDALAKDCYGNMWFGNLSDGLGCIWIDKNHQYHVKYYQEGYFIWADARKPELFVSSTSGLKRLIIDRTGNVIQSFHYQASAGSNSLSSNYTYPIFKQNDTTYWIGTIGGGLDRLILRKDNSYSIKTYGNSYGIFNDVESLEIDNQGNLWLGGNGLLCFNPVTEKLTRYDKNDGLQGNSFKVGSSYKGKNGVLYFGGINGLNYFDPKNIKPNLIPATPVLTDLMINNKRSNPGFSSSIQNISFDKTLELSHLQNNFVISFSAMHYANPLKCKYRYKLIGFDTSWHYTDGKNPSAAYNNLNYYQYNFILEATNNDGIWSKQRASLAIVVIPPWWNSTVARLIYLLAIISILIGIYIYQGRWYRLKREIALRDLENKRSEEMHRHREELFQQQLQFFTNISHEFRTPLTLILGPLENLIKENKNDSLIHSYSLMHRNVKRLINLINELMNFRKTADNVIKLQVQQIAPDEFMDKVFDEFKELAIGKSISFTLEKNIATTPIFIDVQIIEKILFNLLYNSFKYTDTGGKIVLKFFSDFDQYKSPFENEYSLLNEKRAENYIHISIIDTGIGISKESISKIFDRYYRVSNNHLGTGVGLALVKNLTFLHKGDIRVFSERDKGTEIIVSIPNGEENYNQQEKFNDNSGPDSAGLEKIEPVAVQSAMPQNPSYFYTESHQANKKHVLIVEDNDELRSFLKEALKKHFNVHEAANGSEGIELATSVIPDLIISDVMMPVMTGVEFCKEIKKTFETSHIPFIILSAKDAIEAKIEGVESGADYYFSKPVSFDLLLLTINNIFEQRQKLKTKYTKDYYSDATELVHSEKDKEFMNKLLALIDANIKMPELDVDYLCQNLYTSRTKLYKKIKGISDQSVGEFIRTARLKKAIYIMTHEDVSLGELIEKIGFQSISYFSRAFKKEYGKSPSQFLQDLKKNI